MKVCEGNVKCKQYCFYIVIKDRSFKQSLVGQAVRHILHSFQLQLAQPLACSRARSSKAKGTSIYFAHDHCFVIPVYYNMILCFCREVKYSIIFLPGENGWVHWAAIVVNDGEGGTRILGHGNAVPAAVIRYQTKGDLCENCPAMRFIF